MALTKGKKNRIIDQRVIKQKGPDDLSSRFLKEVASEIAEPLTTRYRKRLFHLLGRGLILHLYLMLVLLMTPLIIVLLLLSLWLLRS